MTQVIAMKNSVTSKLLPSMVLAAVLGGLVSGCQVTKSPTGRTQALMYSSSEMAKLGGQSFEQIKQQETTVSDQRINRYVGCVADAITTKLDNPEQIRWEVVVFDSEQVNAFALPGGHIGVYTGLLNVAETPDQLAAVIGHEVGHVLANHSNERLSRSQLTGLGMSIANSAFDLAGVDNKELWMQGLGLGAQFGIALPFGRKQESESDRIGLDLMAKAGFDPKASVALWQNMAAAGGNKQPFEFLSTHPSHDTRKQDLQHNMTQAEITYNQARSQGAKPNCRR